MKSDGDFDAELLQPQREMVSEDFGAIRRIGEIAGKQMESAQAPARRCSCGTARFVSQRMVYQQLLNQSKTSGRIGQALEVAHNARHISVMRIKSFESSVSLF